MPELPEVETIVRALRDGGRGHPSVVGKTIGDARLLWKRTLALPNPNVFARKLRGERIASVNRRGKFIVFNLTHYSLLVHLRMSGDLLVGQDLDSNGHMRAFQPHDRMILHFEDGWRLAFNDARKFGRVWLVEDPATILQNLGPEPLSPELIPEIFHQMLVSRKRQLKPLLLDQSFLAGLGNIYTDEALHLAGLHPLTRAEQLDEAQSAKLLASIKHVLEEGLERNGATIDWVYRGGDFQNHFRVYQRTGEACPVCGTPILRITVGQRGTHFCPVCQPQLPVCH